MVEPPDSGGKRVGASSRRRRGPSCGGLTSGQSTPCRTLSGTGRGSPVGRAPPATSGYGSPSPAPFLLFACVSTVSETWPSRTQPPAPCPSCTSTPPSPIRGRNAGPSHSSARPRSSPTPKVVPHRAHPRGLHTEATTEDVTPGASCRAFPRCPGGVAVDVGDAVLIGHQCRSSSGLLWMRLARTATPRPDNVTDRGAGGVRPACPLTSGRAVDARRAAVAPGRAGWRRSPAVAFAPNALMHARPGRASTHLWGRRRVDQPAADSRVRT